MVFKQILDKLELINQEMNDLSFGEILQNSVDYNNKKINNNLNQISNKKILDCVTEYYNREKVKRGL